MNHFVTGEFADYILSICFILSSLCPHLWSFPLIHTSMCTFVSVCVGVCLKFAIATYVENKLK